MCQQKIRRNSLRQIPFRNKSSKYAKYLSSDHLWPLSKLYESVKIKNSTSTCRFFEPKYNELAQTGR